MKTVVLGLGNPILHDDGAGVEVVGELEKLIFDSQIEFKTAAVGGVRILDHLQGFDRAIIVNALMTGSAAGQVHRMNLEDLTGELNASCTHDLSLKEALEFGRKLGMSLPKNVIIYGIEVSDPYLLQEGCSAEVRLGINKAVELIQSDLKIL